MTTTPATARQTLTAYELVAEIPWSYTVDEDSVVPSCLGVCMEGAAWILGEEVCGAPDEETDLTCDLLDGD